MPLVALIGLALVLGGAVGGASYFFLPVETAALAGGLAASLALALLVRLEAGKTDQRRIRQMEILAREIADLRGELDDARDEVSALRDDVAQVPDTSAVLAELKVLQGLMQQLPARKSGKAAAKEAAGGDAGPATPAPRPTTRRIGNDEMLSIIEEGIRADRIELYLQPIVTLPQRKRVFYECFSRIHGESGEIIAPEQYIPVAERAGLVSAIDNLLLFRCVQLVRRARRDHLNVQFFCNISNTSLTDVDFFQDFVDFLAQNRGLADSLIFEFDQSAIAEPSYETQVNLQRLGALGFRFSMDQVNDLNLDLSNLSGLGFKYVKANAHLIHEYTDGDPPRLDMRAFKGALDRYAMDLIIEKIETEDMLLDLLELKIDFGQGYLFGEPRASARTD